MPDDFDPFRAFPFLADMAKMMGQQGPLSWDAARQLAYSIATEGNSEPNVDPLIRIELEQLARVAELHVASIGGLEASHSGVGLTFHPVTRTQWVARTLDEFRPRFEALALSIGQPSAVPSNDLDLETNDDSALVAQLMAMVQPMTLGMTAGSMIGHLALRSFGQYDIPLPRLESDEILIVVPTIDRFAQEWSLEAESVRLWVCIHEAAYHALFGLSHVRTRFNELTEDFIRGFTPDPGGLERALGDTEMAETGGLEAVQRMFTDPELMLGAGSSPQQAAIRPHLDAMVSVIVGWVDFVMDEVGSKMIGSYPQITEALRRRRVESSEADRYVERIFGLNLTQQQVSRGGAFIQGVIERGGPEALSRLWVSIANLPTPSELEAPGLWLARLDLDSDEPPGAFS